MISPALLTRTAGHPSRLVGMIWTWCGFVGAWVLVAGPLYQGAVELTGEKVDFPAFRSLAHAIAPSERISAWWWLLPPVAYVMTERRQRAWRQQVMAALTPQQRVQFVSYSNKATGWFVVGAGASLIALKETAELVEALDWPTWATLPLAVLAALVALAFTVRRLHLTQRALHLGDAGEDEAGTQ